MPIYAYKCDSCGHTKDVLQKMSDAPLSVCPQCGAPTFKKQLTAAGFQLKGSGWYVTDFRGGASAPAGQGGESGAADSSKSGETGTAPASTTPASTPAPAAAAPAVSSSPAPASGTGSSNKGST